MTRLVQDTISRSLTIPQESMTKASQTDAFSEWSRGLVDNATRFTQDYVNDLFTREAAAFIEKSDPKPFFLYLNYTVPHAELRVPEDSMAAMRGHFEEKPYVNAAADARPTGWQDTSLGYRSQPAPKAAFAAMIQRMDRDIGTLVDLVRAQRGQTLVMFISDNGPHQEGGADPVFFKSSGGLRGIKRDLYEGGIRVPMIVRWPARVTMGRCGCGIWLRAAPASRCGRY